MCPEIVFVEGRHEIYTEYHHRIVEAVESCVPVTAVMSIDEMACRLMGRERPLLAAIALGRKVKTAILEKVGPVLRSSSAWRPIATWPRWPATWKSPTAWWRCRSTFCPRRSAGSRCAICPASARGPRSGSTRKGIRTMDELLALDCEQAGELWGSVWGERLWHWLRGEDFDMAETEHLKSMGHSHVLAPEMRTPEKAWAVAHKLLHKAAMRLRADGLWAGSIGLAIGFAVPRSEKAPVSRFGVPTRGWHSEFA